MVCLAFYTPKSVNEWAQTILYALIRFLDHENIGIGIKIIPIGVEITKYNNKRPENVEINYVFNPKWLPWGLKMDSKLHFNDIIRFCDHKNMGIDPNLTHVGALVFVL